MDHQADAENLEAEHGHGEPLEAAELTDHEGEDNGPEAGADAIDVGYVAGVGDGEAVDGLQVVVEGRVPNASGGLAVVFTEELGTY